MEDGLWPGVFEETEVDGLLVRLDSPRDGLFLLDIDPAYQVVLCSVQ